MSSCSALPGSWRYARGHEHGCYCQAAWQDLWLHSAIKLLGGRVHIGGWNPDRVPVSTFDPRAVMFGAAAAWREVLYFFGQFKCAATAACWHIWCVGLLPRISEARSCAHCRCLRHCVRLRWCLGVRGYYDVRAVGLQGGKLPSSLEVTARCSSEHGLWIVLHYLANTQIRRRHGAARKFKECGHGAMEMQK